MSTVSEKHIGIWARRSSEVKEVKKKEEELKEFLKSVADLAAKVQTAWGPTTLIDIENLNKLTEE